MLLSHSNDSHVHLERADWNRVTANIANPGDSYKDHIIVAAKHGYALVNRTTGQMSYLRKVWDDQEGPEKAERFVCLVR